MNTDILFAFSIFQVTFLLLDVYILAMTGRDIARKGEYTWFCILIVTHMVYLAMNTVWTLQEYNLLHMPRPVLMLVCTISLWTVTNCATSFFMLIVEKLRLQFFQGGPGRVLQALPAVITTGMIVTSPWTGFVFTLSPEGFFIHEKLYMPMLLIASLYLIVVAVVGVVNMLRAHTTFQRRSGAAVFSSVLIILLFIFLDTLTTKASILPAAIFSVIVIVFITMQEANINSDALTGMNNRRKADEYLSDKLTSVSEAEPLCLYMGDLDGFKKINDNYGHIEGDEALVICSRVLKRTIGRFNGFAARFGGDEFLLAWQIGKSKETDPESLIQIVTDSLAEEAAGKPYPLSMSIGYVLCTNPKESLSACIKRADEMLYRKKALRGAGR